MKEQKDVRQRIEEGEFAQSAEISASYLDEDILIIDNVKVLQNPDPMRFQMNMIASCQRGSLRAELNGRELTVEKGDIFISPPNSILDIKEVSEYFAVDASKVTPIPEDMSYEEGAMIEPLAVAVHGVKQMGDVTGMKIAVLGAGPIGNLVAQTAKGMGADKVMITDVSDLRLEKAKECGIDVCVNTAKKDFGEAMIEAFGPDKADVIYDCAGNNITMGQAIKYARKGSTIVLVAVFAGMAEVDLAVANDHELDIKSTMMYRHDDYLDGIRLVKEEKVHLRPLISKTFAFKDYLEAYHYIDANRETTMKVIINVQEK